MREVGSSAESGHVLVVPALGGMMDFLASSLSLRVPVSSAMRLVSGSTAEGSVHVERSTWEDLRMAAGTCQCPRTRVQSTNRHMGWDTRRKPEQDDCMDRTAAHVHHIDEGVSWNATHRHSHGDAGPFSQGSVYQWLGLACLHSLLCTKGACSPCKAGGTQRAAPSRRCQRGYLV